MNLQNTPSSEHILLSEILPKPSEKIITDRFTSSEEAYAAPCSGVCGSGVCRTVA